MQVSTRWAGTEVTMTLVPEPGDPEASGQIQLAHHEARFRLPVEVQAGDVHPDVEALLGLLMAQPFSTSVNMARGVSPELADAAAAMVGPTIGPVDPALTPRVRPAGGRVGLAYSGGVDSTAALAVLPADTVSCFLNRVDPPREPMPSAYSPAAALHACLELDKQGRRTVVVDSDVEHLRIPVGFTSHFVNAAGAILLAEHERLDSLAWGVIAESAYGIGHERYVDWRSRNARWWGPTFAAAGLPMCNPVAGVSEVGTAMIVRRAPEGAVAQSCVRGEVDAPCRNCAKCVRKLLLDAAITGAWPDDAGLDALFRTRQASKFLGQQPIKHENVVAWIAGRYTGTNLTMRRLQERTRSGEQDLDWLTRSYGPAIELLPEPHRATISANLGRFLAPMTPADEAAMQAWDMTALLADPETSAASRRLVRGMRALSRGPAKRPAASPTRRLLRRLRRLLPAGAAS